MADFSDLGANTSTTSGLIRNEFSFRLADFANLNLARSLKLSDDPDHSDGEDRFVLLGLSSSLKVLLVCHCYREEGNVIRIISARKASTQETKEYP